MSIDTGFTCNNVPLLFLKGAQGVCADHNQLWCRFGPTSNPVYGAVLFTKQNVPEPFGLIVGIMLGPTHCIESCPLALFTPNWVAKQQRRPARTRTHYCCTEDKLVYELAPDDNLCAGEADLPCSLPHSSPNCATLPESPSFARCGSRFAA